MNASDVQLDGLARASRRAALGTLFGALFGLSALLYLGFRVESIDQEIRAKQDELAAKQNELAATEKQNEDARAELEKTQAELKIAEGELNTVQKKLDAEQERTAIAEQTIEKYAPAAVKSRLAREGVAVTEVKKADVARLSKPDLSIEPAGWESQGRPLYNVKMWVEVPDALRAGIRRVDYVFGPGFTPQTKQSYSTDDDFSVKFIAWGCTREVKVTAQLRSGESVSLPSLAMCARFPKNTKK